jgi:16S rRNA (guanine527-N7)-methyltransferase
MVVHSPADRFRDALGEGARAIGLTLEPRWVGALVEHYALLIKWNRKMNLTAVTDPVEAAHLHGLDSLLFAELVEEGDESKTVDVGSGAGFPGIPLAVARPSLAMTLLEPIRKRASFLRVALAELRLPAVRVVEGKLEGPPALADRDPMSSQAERAASRRRAKSGGPALADRDPLVWPAGLVVSRAVVAPVELAALVRDKLAPGGRLIVTSGASAPAIADYGSTGLVHARRIERRLPKEQVRILDVLTT